MRKPIIGIVPLVDRERESYWMLPGYMRGIEKAGGIPVMLPLTSDEKALEQLGEALDGFLFTGGQDVSPNVYGAEPAPACGERCEERDEMEKILFRAVYGRNKPVFGICRGIQFINAVMGGTLYQDIPTEHPSGVCHRQAAPYDIPAHPVKMVADSPLQRLFTSDVLMVNSCHHQAIKTMADGLSAMAYSEDGLVEAVYAPDRDFLWAVQWHPEFSCESDENSRQILREFVRHCQDGAQHSGNGERGEQTGSLQAYFTCQSQVPEELSSKKG